VRREFRKPGTGKSRDSACSADGKWFIELLVASDKLAYYASDDLKSKCLLERIDANA
jgi:hypothetical protein